MNIPAATYRIQFRDGMDFDKAATLIPYLKHLGISHLYASPVFTATSDSTHGYDITDANEIDPILGGREGFDRLSQALKAAGMGLILDIVPNHMAASLENPWWRDVIEQGEKSRYARHFDIDWSRRLTLPFLGDTFEEVLAKGEITLKPDPQTGQPALAYFDAYYPLAPDTYPSGETPPNHAALADLHERQPYRLMSWRDAPRELSYRRFFEITGLAGVRVEDDAVFDDTHRLILELVHSGAVSGLRVDHVDGLADPKAYLERLREKAGAECYITVEKILGKGERLPADWPVSGTTGYEFIAALSDVLVEDENIAVLRNLYENVVGKPVDMRDELRAAKLMMVEKNFEGEFNTLCQLALDIAGKECHAWDANTLRAALRELLIAFPVYRTYGTSQGLPADDAALLHQIIAKINTSALDVPADILDFLARIISAQTPACASGQASLFRTRFQQLTGPLMAKSVEDTLFFRQHMDLALNEVGAEPLLRKFSPDRFHQEMSRRLEEQPAALSTTSTHDTKRGEDARARLFTLTEAPELWAENVTRWHQMNQSKVLTLPDGPAPKLTGAWMLYQALAGAWPATLRPDDKEGLSELNERLQLFVEKALREAKLRTNWGDSNDDYENAVLGYTRHLVSPDNPVFLNDFYAALRPFIRAGLVNSLTQTVIKMMAPGVPDIYQGSELLNDSLVDPDNRRLPDFSELERLLVQGEKPEWDNEAAWTSGQLKQHIVAVLARYRQQKPALFLQGDYVPLTATGDRAENVIAFARQEKNDAVIVAAPRLVFDEQTVSFSQSQGGFDMQVLLPDSLAHRSYRDLQSGREITVTDRIDLSTWPRDEPVVLCSVVR
ncbi:malto-oligosyltrehalose synthase [Rahnella woolbedingensis]|uniref:Malto-oligosyltrehalose synthase n=1 Tax=Rahnella woolbedingensis TaxID=1510574 RepID=A0A419N7T1_9GAMM|nr:malto-oligosyltrehalose synthase [Rahnella woolbedingensis]RJT43352.1 malto-oligosyltrehalose synthase [Rahnella woolbedingensis]